MSLRASLSVILGCNFSSANRLLSAAERGDEAAVRQVRGAPPGFASPAGDQDACSCNGLGGHAV